MAGRVRAGCRGAVITLDGGYAQPEPGWTVRVSSGGPDEVQVVFEMQDQAILVISSCGQGSPQFEQYQIEAGHQNNSPHSSHHSDDTPQSAASGNAVTQSSAQSLVDAASTSAGSSQNPVPTASRGGEITPDPSDRLSCRPVVDPSEGASSPDRTGNPTAGRGSGPPSSEGAEPTDSRVGQASPTTGQQSAGPSSDVTVSDNQASSSTGSCADSQRYPDRAGIPWVVGVHPSRFWFGRLYGHRHSDG
jgi:hypothetical protein